MPNYTVPGVFIEPISSLPSDVESNSSSIGGFVGTLVRGVLEIPTLVTSWQDFLNKFAYGMETPFLSNSDLAYAVYGFFQNGGKQCYIVRTAHKTASDEEEVYAIAGVTVGTPTTFAVTAKDAGAWGNNVSVAVGKNEDYVVSTNEIFDLYVKYGTEVVEVFKGLSNSLTSAKYFLDYVNDNSNYISITSGTLVETVVETVLTYKSLTNGTDGITTIVDADYSRALGLLSAVDACSLVCIPGQATTAMIAILTAFAEANPRKFIILDSEKAKTVAEIKAVRKTIDEANMAIYYPWGKVSDPLSNRGKLRDCPVSGHVMGVYSRIINSRGVWKSPAGTEAVVKGVVDLYTELTQSNIETLSSANVNPIVVKANYGTVIWGAKSTSTEEDWDNVSDSLLNSYIYSNVYNLLQQFIFEPHDEYLWTRVKSAVTTFFDTLWKDGGLKGSSSSDAYYVKCDADLNTEEVIASGQIICETGYARKHPADFIIIRISRYLGE